MTAKVNPLIPTNTTCIKMFTTMDNGVSKTLMRFKHNRWYVQIKHNLHLINAAAIIKLEEQYKADRKEKLSSPYTGDNIIQFPLKKETTI